MAQTHRSFTLRVPVDFYLKMGSIAQEEDVPLNHVANRLLKLGMNRDMDIQKHARLQLIDQVTTDPELRAALIAENDNER